MLYFALLLSILQPSTAGSLTSTGGLSASYRHVFNRNAIADSRIVGDDLVAMTPSGLLLRFALPRVDPVDVVYPQSPIVSLGTGADGELLAGAADGAIYRVDVPAMTLAPVARAPSGPVWVGGYRASSSSSSSIVAIVGREETTTIEIHDLGTGGHWSPDVLAGRVTALLDRSARLWIGSDNGEWGGWVGRLDLPEGPAGPAGKARLYPDCLTYGDDRSRNHDLHQFACDGVVGFTELRDGRIWMYGGMTHLGVSSARIARLEEADLVQVFDNRSGKPTVRDDDPRRPLSHLVEHPTRDEIYAFASGEVFRTDRRLSRWQRIDKIQVLDHAGRPEAVGSFPAVTAVEWLSDTDELLVSTAFDGIVRLRGRQQERAGFPGDLGAASIERMARTRDGVVFFEERSAWHQSDGDWEEHRLAPRQRPRFAMEELRDYGDWRVDFAFVDAAGDVVAVSETNIGPGPRATVRWRGGEAEILSMERSGEGYLASGFATPDGDLWALSGKGIFRFESGWKHAASLPVEEDVFRPEVEVLDTGAPPWLLLEKNTGSLSRLWREGASVRIRPVQTGDRLYDVARFRGDWVFATSRGLRRYDVRRDRWSDFEITIPGGPVRVLAVDDAGRLWLGGSGLALVDGGRAVEWTSIPALRGVDVIAMIADPHRRSGIIASLGKRGLLYVATE